jgi:hypothetical protein
MAIASSWIFGGLTVTIAMTTTKTSITIISPALLWKEIGKGEFTMDKLFLAIIILGCLLVASFGVPVWFLECPLTTKLFITLFAVGSSVFLALLGVYVLRET